MTKISAISTAVAAILASTAASAAQVDIYASGSSALQGFFQKDMTISLCGYTTATQATTAAAATTASSAQAAGTASADYIVYGYEDTSLGATAGQPGYTLTTCVGATGTTNANTTFALHYASDLGSTWGIAGALNTSLTRNQIVSTTGCTTASYDATNKYFYCQEASGSHYDRVNDTSPTLNPNTMSAHASDILAFDVEAGLFGDNSGDNWPTANSNPLFIPNVLVYGTDAFGNPVGPTVSQLATVNPPVVNGQIFSIIVKNDVPGIGSASGGLSGNLSSNSLRAILSGAYTYWKEVPEVGSADASGTKIVLCRRDHGSGSEIAASLTFMGSECGTSGTTIASTSSPGNLSGGVFEEPSTQDVRNCVSGTTGAIGLAGLSSSASWTTISIDGYQPNAHNAAAGLYQFAYEDHAVSNTAHSGASAAAVAAVTTLLADAAAQAKLQAVYHESATLAGGQWTTSAPAGYYTAQLAGVNTAPTVGSGAFSTATQPVQTFNRLGNSCTQKLNNNIN